MVNVSHIDSTGLKAPVGIKLEAFQSVPGQYMQGLIDDEQFHEYLMKEM